VAYLMQSEKDKEDQGQTGPTQLSGGTSVISGGGSSGVKGVSNAQPKPSSSGFVNLDKYLSANSGQTAQMADRVSSKVSDQARSGIEAVGNSVSQFKTMATGPADTSGLASQVRNDPTKVNRDEFNTARTATYQGPKSVADVSGFADARQSVSRAEKMANSWQTAGGRSDLLQNSFGGEKYTGGMRGLDQALLQADDAAVQKGIATTSKYGDLSKYLGDAESETSKIAADKEKQFADSKAALDQALAQGVAQRKQDIDARVVAENARRTADRNNLLGLSSGLDPNAYRNTAALNGISVADWSRLNPFEARFIRGGAPVDQSHVVTDTELAQLQALQALGADGAGFVTSRNAMPINVGIDRGLFDQELAKLPAPLKTGPIAPINVDMSMPGIAQTHRNARPGFNF
jgi:hypothetical protein